MGKTKGAIDRVLYRKRRSDFGKKRRNYSGKPCIHKPRRKSKRIIGNKTSLWLRAYWRIPMSKDGLRNIKRNRERMYKEVTNMKMSPTFREVPLELINTKDKFERFFADRLWEDERLGGKFVIMGGGNGKTKTGFKPYAICTVKIKQTSDDNICTITESKRLHKYKWFYKG